MKATESGYDAGAHWAAHGEMETAVRWRRAFAAYCEGLGMTEIAISLDVNYETLRTKSAREDWPEARNKLIFSRIDQSVIVKDKVEQQIARIKDNREKNLAEAVKLRDVLVEIATKLQAGTLTVTKAFQFKGTPVLVETPPSTGDLVNIATFARTVADLTYRALGDQSADSKSDFNVNAAALQPPPGITVILPACAVEPRQRRAKTPKPAIDVQADAIMDLQPLPPSVAPPVAQSPPTIPPSETETPTT